MADIVRKTDLLRAKCWYDKTARFIGGVDTPKSPNWFARKFKRDTHIFTKDGLTDWKKYRWGKSVPVTKDEYFAVDRVAEKYPGSDRIFKALFWSVLKSEKVSIKTIEAKISALGMRTSVRRNLKEEITADSMNCLGDYVTETEPYGIIGHIILDKNFWKKGVGTAIIQKARFACLEDMADFDVLQAIVLMLSWADKNKYSELWNELCNFYYHLIPWFIMDEDIPFRFEILDIVDGFARKRELIPFREPTYLQRKWKEQMPRFQELLSEHYSACFKVQRKYGVLPKEIFSDNLCDEFAGELAKDVVRDNKLMMKCRDLWKPMSWELAKLTRGHFGDETMTKELFDEILDKNIGYYLDKRSKPKDYDDPFSIEFRG